LKRKFEIRFTPRFLRRIKTLDREAQVIQEGFKETIPTSERWDTFSELTNSIADDMFHTLSKHFGSGSTERLKSSISMKAGARPS